MLNLDNCYAPETADDADDESDLGRIYLDGEWFTPGEVLELIRTLHGFVTAATDARARGLT